MTVYNGICQNGPWHNKTRAVQDKQTFTTPGNTEGFYRYVAPRGPTPGQWLWIKKKELMK